jgi:hypothetical protein
MIRKLFLFMFNLPFLKIGAGDFGTSSTEAPQWRNSPIP